MARTEGSGKGFAIDPTVGVFVSLYLILLAFFIVLNVISNQETARARAVMESTAKAFERPFPDEAYAPGLAPPAPHAAVDREFLVEAGELVLGMLGPAESRPAGGGASLEILLDVHDLFFRDSARASEQAGAFLARLATLLAAAGPEMRREASFLFGMEEGDNALARARAETLAEAMAHAQAPEGAFAVGLEPRAGPRQILLRLRAGRFAAMRIDLAPKGEGR